TLPASGAEVGPANHGRARGRLVTRVELDRLLPVAGEDNGSARKSKRGSRQRRCHPAGHRENPFPSNEKPKARLVRWLNSKWFFCSFVRGHQTPRCRQTGTTEGEKRWRGCQLA